MRFGDRMSISALTSDRATFARHPVTQEIALLTEATVEKMFRSLMNESDRNESTFDKAEELLEEELRPESPLRHRLSVELEELRSQTQQS